MKEHIQMVRKADKVNIHGQMEVSIKDHGEIIKFKVMVNTFGTMEGVI